MGNKTILKEWQYLSETIIDSRFRQSDLFTQDAFINFCKERDLIIAKETLNYLDSIDLFKPILKLKLNRGISLGPTSLQYYKNNNLIISQSEKNNINKQVTKIYHPYQILLLNVILGRFSCYFIPPYTLKGISQAANIVKKLIKRNKISLDHFKRNALDNHLKLLGILFAIEAIYLPDINKTFHRFDLEPEYNEWLSHIKTFNPIKTLKRLKLSENFIKGFYEQLDTDVYFIDPLREWLPLLRYMPMKKRNKLRGKALLAQIYYEVLDILRAFMKSLPQTIPLSGHYEIDAEWLGKLFGKKINYEDFDVLEGILNSFGINPSPTVTVFVEGRTEFEVLNKLFEMYSVSIERVGIKIEDLGGVGQFDINRIENMINYFLRKYIDCFFILDPEGRVKTQAKKLKSKFPKLRNNIIVWQKDFEKDNFTSREIANVLLKYAQSIGLNLIISKAEVKNSKTLRNLFCGKLNDCNEMLTCRKSSNAIANCPKSINKSDRLDKPMLGVQLTQQYLSPNALKRKRKHPSQTKGIIKVFNEIIRHASAKVADRRF